MRLGTLPVSLVELLLVWFFEEPDELELLELPGAVKLVEGSERFELLVLPELEVPELEVFEAVPLGPEVLLEEELPDEVPVPCEALGSK